MCTLKHILNKQLLEDELQDYAEVLSNSTSEISKEIFFKALNLEIPETIAKFKPLICLELTNTFRIIVSDNNILKVLILDKECNIVKSIPSYYNVRDRIFKIMRTLISVWNDMEPTALSYIRNQNESKLESKIFEKYGELKTLSYTTLKEIANYCDIDFECTKTQETVLNVTGKNLDTQDKFCNFLKYLKKLNEKLCYQLFLYAVQRYEIHISVDSLTDEYKALV